MTTVRQLITDALRESGIIPVGEDVDADVFEEALRVFNRVFRSLLGTELGEPLKDVNYGTYNLSNAYAIELDLSSELDSIYVPSNSRVILNIDSPETLWLNPNPRDGTRAAVIDNQGNVGTYNVTVQGNGRQVESAQDVVLNTNNVSREWFYRADLGNWVKVTDLVDTDVSPLPEEFDDLLTTFLALRLNPRYGATTSQEMTLVLKRIKRIFSARYQQINDQNAEIGLYRLPSTRYYWQVGNNTKVFNKGKYWWYW